VEHNNDQKETAGVAEEALNAHAPDGKTREGITFPVTVFQC